MPPDSWWCLSAMRCLLVGSPGERFGGAPQESAARELPQPPKGDGPLPSAREHYGNPQAARQHSRADP